ncbi:MAG: hypothetical protein ACOYB3_11150 [Azonexus sp.]
MVEKQMQDLVVVSNKQGAQNMKHIQKWFELMAGISQEELAREERAREIFAGASPDLQSLQKPACWRRQCRVIGARG